MKRYFLWLFISFSALVMGSASIASVISMDWHSGGFLYLAHESGDVVAYDEQARPVRIFHLPGFVPAEIVSAKVGGREIIIISGFKGREGTIFIWDSVSGQLISHFSTPELAAGIDIDPGTTAPKHAHILYIASAITNSVYVVNLDHVDQKPSELISIKGARSVGPIVFDQSRNRLFIGDQGSGELYEMDCASGRYATAASDLGTPISLALDSASETLFVADSLKNRIHIFKIGQSDGRLSRSAPMLTGLESVNAIALAPDSSLYVASRTSVYRLSPKTHSKVLVINTPPNAPNPPTNLTVVVQ